MGAKMLQISVVDRDPYRKCLRKPCKLVFIFFVCLSRRGTVLTLNRDTSSIWGLCTFLLFCISYLLLAWGRRSWRTGQWEGWAGGKEGTRGGG